MNITPHDPVTTKSTTKSLEENLHEPSNRQANPSQAECLLRCVISHSPSAGLAQRFSGINRLYREMSAPYVLSHSKHLLADESKTLEKCAKIPMVPIFSSPSAVRKSTDRDVTWVNLNWKIPHFYGLGSCESIAINPQQKNQLSKWLLLKKNNQDYKSTNALIAENQATLMRALYNELKPIHNSPEAQTTETILLVRAKSAIESLFLHYQVPKTPGLGCQNPQHEPAMETRLLHCQVLPLRMSHPPEKIQTLIHETNQTPFLGIVHVSFQIAGQHSDLHPIEAQLLKAAIKNQHLSPY